ncbi:hypothetical protein BDZ45DRAFT_743301 [Acephala macrosclerotiorum]|nr:hypothetical protein BDZ45DRAFT_743301 [Acephala macrosclerotiorum]
MAGQIAAYLATARAATAQLSLLAAPTLINLQALCHGAIVSQEAGDLGSAWSLTPAGSTMCLRLELHRKQNQFRRPDTPHDTVCEAYYCLTFCYVNDKGLAMSLGRSSHFKDSEIEVDLLKKPDPENSLKRQFYIDLAIIQSGIVHDLQSRSTHRDPNEVDIILNLLLHRLDEIWQKIRIAQTEAEKTLRDQWIDPSFEWLMVDFTFYSLKAALLTAPALSHKSRARHKNAALEAARASLNELQKARHFATILYFPFTSFFILFCNVATTNYLPDYNSMKEFVVHLSEVRETSQAMAELHNLCQAFCTLAATLLSAPESASKRLSISEGANSSETPPRKRLKSACTEKMASMPVESTINTLNPMSYNGTSDTSMADGMAPPMADNFGPKMSLPVGDINYGPIPYVDNDSSLWQLLDTQPRLQWLDTDLSAFDNMWGDPNLY